MAKTRSKSMKSSSAKRSYRMRVKTSKCRGKGPAVCRAKPTCRYVSGPTRRYCRKSKNSPLMKMKKGGMCDGTPHGGMRMKTMKKMKMKMRKGGMSCGTKMSKGGMSCGTKMSKGGMSCGTKMSKGGNMLSKALLPFGLFGLQKLYSRKNKKN